MTWELRTFQPNQFNVCVKRWMYFRKYQIPNFARNELSFMSLLHKNRHTLQFQIIIFEFVHHSELCEKKWNCEIKRLLPYPISNRYHIRHDIKGNNSLFMNIYFILNWFLFIKKKKTKKETELKNCIMYKRKFQ